MGYTKPLELESITMTPPPSRQSSISLVQNALSSTDDGFSYDHALPKEPTPVLGSWADVWSSRQASEIILEDIDKEKESASMQLVLGDEVQEPIDEELAQVTTDNDEMTPSASSVSTAPTSATMAAVPLEDVFPGVTQEQQQMPVTAMRPTIEVPAPVATSAEQYYPGYPIVDPQDMHQRHVYSYNPYSQVNTRQDIHVCNCASCVAQNRAAHAELEYQRAAAIQAPEMTGHPEINVITKNSYKPRMTETTTTTPPTARPVMVEAPMPLKASPLTPPVQKPAGGGFQSHSAVPPPPNHVPRDANTNATVTAPQQTPSAQQLSLFMPPPPPSLMTSEILERDGTADANGFISYTMSRWYQKTAAVQDYFVSANDMCPNPETMDFDSWCQACTDWWFRNFEFAQMKPSAYAAIQGYSAPYGYNPSVPTANPVAPGGYNASAAPVPANVW